MSLRTTLSRRSWTRASEGRGAAAAARQAASRRLRGCCSTSVTRRRRSGARGVSATRRRSGSRRDASPCWPGPTWRRRWPARQASSSATAAGSAALRTRQARLRSQLGSGPSSRINATGQRGERAGRSSCRRDLFVGNKSVSERVSEATQAGSVRQARLARDRAAHCPCACIPRASHAAQNERLPQRGQEVLPEAARSPANRRRMGKKLNNDARDVL
jgi:hypothetical protein